MPNLGPATAKKGFGPFLVPLSIGTLSTGFKTVFGPAFWDAECLFDLYFGAFFFCNGKIWAQIKR